MKRRSIICISCLLGLLYACSPVKPYQKAFINDAEMELNAKASQKFELNFQAYREGASGAGGGKTGGGCGCN